MPNERMTQEELVEELMKEFEEEYGGTIENAEDFFNFEKNMLTFLIKKGKEMTKKKQKNLREDIEEA